MGHPRGFFIGKSHKARGFSLLELVIAVAIIGILSIVIFPNFSKIQNRAKEATLKTLVYTIQMAVESHYLTTGVYPLGQALAITELATILKSSGDLNRPPKNPYTGKDYTASDPSGRIEYSFDTTLEQYTLLGFGYKNQTEIIRVENL